MTGFEMEERERERKSYVLVERERWDEIGTAAQLFSVIWEAEKMLWEGIVYLQLKWASTPHYTTPL